MRKKHRKMNRMIALIARLVLIVIIAVAGFTVCIVLKKNSVSGKWVRSIDITDAVVSNAALWLSDIEYVDYDSDKLKEMISPLSIDIILEMNKTGLGKGNYKVYISDSSYEACSDAAGRLLVTCMEDAVLKGLTDAGYRDSVSPEMAQSAIRDVLGMGMDEFLRDRGVDIMLSKDKISGGVIGEGEYEAGFDKITWNYNGTSVTEDYVLNRNKLILPDEGYIYIRSTEGK